MSKRNKLIALAAAILAMVGVLTVLTSSLLGAHDAREDLNRGAVKLGRKIPQIEQTIAMIEFSQERMSTEATGSQQWMEDKAKLDNAIGFLRSSVPYVIVLDEPTAQQVIEAARQWVQDIKNM